MTTMKKSNVIQVKLNLSKMDIDERMKLLSVIATAAPQSSVYAAEAVVKDAADKAIKSGKTLEDAAKDLHSAEQKVVAARSAMMAAQEQADKDLVFFKSSAEAKCKTEQELNELGFNRRPPKAPPAPLAAPDEITARPGKDKGSMIVQVKRVGAINTYAAEISADPIGSSSWQPIPGLGTRRNLAGYTSGAHYWVRFRAVRAKEESPWSDAVSVIAA